jgi:hypothetical protein
MPDSLTRIMAWWIRHRACLGQGCRVPAALMAGAR